MTSTDMYAILSQKPHNPHHLRRYLKFIDACKVANKACPPQYAEEHHICPKASDLFPEYIDLTKHKWNGVKLSARQHILAHIMLWKTYPRLQSTVATVHYMLNVQNSDTIWFNLRNVPPSIRIRYAAESKEEFYRSRKGFGVYKDSTGNRYFLHKSDPKIQELGLVGAVYGRQMTEESKELMRRAKDPHRKVEMFYKGTRQSKMVKINQPEYQEHIDAGWVLERSPESYVEAREYQKNVASETLKGTSNYYYPNGVFYGRIPFNSPVIEELGLVHIRSEKQKKQSSANAAMMSKDPVVQAKKSAAISKLKWFHNPATNERKRLQECPEGWEEGRGGVSPTAGRRAYNDGVKNFMLLPHQVPEPHWVPGMAPQKQREFNYTNGTEWITLKKGDPVPAGFYRAKRPSSRSKYNTKD